MATELWLGNEKLSYITHQAVYELRVDFQMSTGEHFYTTYKGFRITDEFGEYKLSYIGTFEGTSGMQYLHLFAQVCSAYQNK